MFREGNGGGFTVERKPAGPSPFRPRAQEACFEFQFKKQKCLAEAVFDSASPTKGRAFGGDRSSQQ